jgi:hypothetical protein
MVVSAISKVFVSGGILAGRLPDQPLDDGAGGLLRNGTNV